MTLMLVFSPFARGENLNLEFKQKLDGGEVIYHISETLIMMDIKAQPGCRGFCTERVEHDVPGELKLKINHMWDITATFEGEKDAEKIKAMMNKVYIFKYEDGKVLSVKEAAAG